MALATKERILDAARDLFVERGENAVTMRAVAGVAGITPMAIYRHFADREALLQAVVAQGHATFLQYLQRSSAAPSPQARLLASGQAYLDFALEHPRDYDLMFMRAVASDAGRQPTSWQAAATFRFLVDRIRECDAAGVLHAPAPEALALTVWAQVHGLVSLFLARKLGIDAAAFRPLYAAALERLLAALADAATSTTYTRKPQRNQRRPVRGVGGPT